MSTQAPSIPLVTLTVDGKEVQVPRGTNVIEAARKIGIDIPYLCYHHQLTPFGGCRLCLVEIEKVPRLLAACNTLVAEGMAVRTTSDKVKSQRAGSLEFILLNHPLDCPVCDKGGECELQDRVFGHSNALSQLTEPKVHVEDYDLGPLVVRNQDRCIICKRCVKVMEEIVGEPVLEFGQRGVTTEVYTFEHTDFEPGFSGNTIRVCPVGALMSKPFRFKARPWELQKTPGICTLCSVGCNVRRDVRENQLLRVVGIENPRVNDGWLCDRGQFGYDAVNSPDRLSAPLVRRADGSLEETSWSEALEIVATRLGAVRDANRAGFGAIASDSAANEDLFALQHFTREVMGSPNVDHRNGSTRHHYDATRPSPGALERLGQSDVVLLVGTDLTAEAPVLDLLLKRGLLPKKLKLVLAYPRRTRLNPFAANWLQYTPGQEIAVVNALCKVLVEEGLVAQSVIDEAGPAWEALHLGLSRSLAETCRLAGVDLAEVRAAARDLGRARRVSVVFGQGPIDARDGAYVLAALENLSLLLGKPDGSPPLLLEAVQQANTWGARDLGVLPCAGPGGRRVARGLTTGEMFQGVLDGKIQALYVMGANPAAEHPSQSRTRKALEAVEFLVVSDQFLTETAALAHVVLPTVSVEERNCSFTNVERRVQRTIRAMAPRGSARADWEILGEVADALKTPMPFSTLKEIQAAAAETQPELAAPPAIRLQRVETPMPPNADANYPLRLFTGRLLFDRGRLQRRSTVLPGLCPDPFVEVHAADAERFGLQGGERVTVHSPYGQLDLQLLVTEDIPAGSAYVPSGYDTAPAAHLWVEGTNVVHCRLSRAAQG